MATTPRQLERILLNEIPDNREVYCEDCSGTLMSDDAAWEGGNYFHPACLERRRNEEVDDA